MFLVPSCRFSCGTVKEIFRFAGKNDFLYAVHKFDKIEIEWVKTRDTVVTSMSVHRNSCAGSAKTAADSALPSNPSWWTVEEKTPLADDVQDYPKFGGDWNISPPKQLPEPSPTFSIPMDTLQPRASWKRYRAGRGFLRFSQNNLSTSGLFGWLLCFVHFLPQQHDRWFAITVLLVGVWLKYNRLLC